MMMAAVVLVVLVRTSDDGGGDGDGDDDDREDGDDDVDRDNADDDITAVVFLYLHHCTGGAPRALAHLLPTTIQKAGEHFRLPGSHEQIP